MGARSTGARRTGLRQRVLRTPSRGALAPEQARGADAEVASETRGGVDRWVPQRWWLIPLAGATIAVALCLLLAQAAGFPLDDSWIHQDFARTLATTGRFAFQPGRGGAGSTSPLWVLLLLPPHLVTDGQAPTWLLVGWSAALGVGALGGLGLLTGAMAAELARRAGAAEGVAQVAAVIGSVATVTEWHLVWAAASGMETDLFALLIMLLLWGAARRVSPLWLGLLAGATLAVRPEGLLADALVVCGTCWVGVRRETPAESGAVELAPRGARPGMEARRVRRWLRGWLVPFLTGGLLAAAPYILLNVGTTGRLLPSTFYAKGAFYGSGETAAVVLGYGGQVLVVLLLSSPVLLVVAALSCSRRLLHGSERPIRLRPAGGHFPLKPALTIWPLLLLLAYGIHLPTLYHHGRYLMPALPALLSVAAAGAAPLLVNRGRALLRVVGGLTLLGSSLFSVGRGAQIYGSNVRYIDDFQVSTARWLRVHTPAGALVATHDVGAIGYFSDRPVLDMAGLIDPQVVPFVSNQDALESYLARRHAAYVVMFVDWYPPPATLVRQLSTGEVHRAHAQEFASQPGSVFVVYRTGW
jgi:hypothetical protein